STPPPPPTSSPSAPPPDEEAGIAEGLSDLAEAAAVHADALASLISAGVFDGAGCGEGRLCPGEPILRWEMAVLMVRILDGDDPSDAAAGSRFDDVGPSLWWAPFVERLAELGVTLGCRVEPARYCPFDPVTRGQTASFLTRAFDLAEAPSAGFVDAVGGAHEADIDALAAAQITNGCRPQRFCPGESTSRQEMASFLHRASPPESP
ncbi:MAG: S-layer homology domain-containing protein, partial [Acidimicrobiaceae bacterium]|nr:S-layer homology domain-containing protein [Acidimicrobiaceae bacterium]